MTPGTSGLIFLLAFLSLCGLVLAMGGNVGKGLAATFTPDALTLPGATPATAPGGVPPGSTAPVPPANAGGSGGGQPAAVKGGPRTPSWAQQ